MTVDELFDKLYNLKTTEMHSFSKDGYTLYISIPKHYIPAITKSLWTKIGFDGETSIKLSDVPVEYNKCDKIYKRNKIRIDYKALEISTMFKEHLKDNEECIKKLLDARLKQLKRQQEKKQKNNDEKMDRLRKFNKELTELGYDISKVVSGYYSKDREVPDKYHKYIETDSNNIKFATVEVKINKDDYKIGFKLETKGQIGCTFEELSDIYKKLDIERQKLEDALNVK